jgi:aryl-alcohol dehydrogenase-like predicted oxidoreductase
VLRNPAITGAIVGARNAKQVEGIAGAAELTLAPGEVDELLAV